MKQKILRNIQVKKKIFIDFLKDVPSKRNLKSDNYNEGINNFIFR